MDLFRGTVTRVTAAGVFVLVPSRWPGVELGPCERVAPVTAVSTTGTASSHTHPIPVLASALVAGDLVVVGRFDDGDFVILGRRA